MTAGERRRQVDARGPHVTGDQHPPGRLGVGGDEDGECRSDALDQLGIELIGDGASHVVRLEDLRDGRDVGRNHERRL
jgi:hypothetical protein